MYDGALGSQHTHSVLCLRRDTDVIVLRKLDMVNATVAEVQNCQLNDWPRFELDLAGLWCRASVCIECGDGL